VTDTQKAHSLKTSAAPFLSYTFQSRLSSGAKAHGKSETCLS
jgi:hypothetical protein